MTLRPFAICAIAAMTLAGCGKMGVLERPGPLFGDPPAASAGAASAPARSVRTVDPRTFDDRPLPPRTVPVDSQPSATSSAPQGALPDPYQTPR